MGDTGAPEVTVVPVLRGAMPEGSPGELVHCPVDTPVEAPVVVVIEEG